MSNHLYYNHYNKEPQHEVNECQPSHCCCGYIKSFWLRFKLSWTFTIKQLLLTLAPSQSLSLWITFETLKWLTVKVNSESAPSGFKALLRASFLERWERDQFIDLWTSFEKRNCIHMRETCRGPSSSWEFRLVFSARRNHWEKRWNMISLWVSLFVWFAIVAMRHGFFIRICCYVSVPRNVV